MVTDHDRFAVRVELPGLSPPDRLALAEILTDHSGRLPALIAGDLPLEVSETAEELGIEVLPHGGEFVAQCGCDHWLPPCRHALAVLIEVSGRIDSEPMLLLEMRGMGEVLLGSDPHPETEADLAIAAEAAAEAARMLAGGAASVAPSPDAAPREGADWSP